MGVKKRITVEWTLTQAEITSIRKAASRWGFNGGAIAESLGVLPHQVDVWEIYEEEEYEVFFNTGGLFPQTTYCYLEGRDRHFFRASKTLADSEIIHYKLAVLSRFAEAG